MARVAVVGAGLAGLTAACRLAEAGHDVTVFERRAEVGGRVRSVTVGGFTFDRGFQVLFTAYPAARRELDLSALDLRRFVPGATIARPGSRSILSDPVRDPRALTETLFNAEVRTADKLRLLRLGRRLGRTAPADLGPGRESIATYLEDRGFSRAFRRNFAAPFYGGITLDRSLSTSSYVFEFTFKMLVEGAIAVPAAGMGAIPAQLADRARRAGAGLECGAEVEAVEATEGRATVRVGGETVPADAVVVATDPSTARSLTGVEAIPTAGRGCVTQYYALPAAKTLDTGRRLLLNAADASPNQVAPMSAVAPEYAPADRQLLSATFLGTDAPAEELARGTRAALADWYPEHRFDDLEVLRTERVEFAQVAQPPGFRESRPTVDAPDGPVVLAGDYLRWSSIQGAIESGRVAAATLRATAAA